MWYWPWSTLEGMECPRMSTGRSARDFGEPFQREDVHFNTTWSYIIYHWSCMIMYDHTWSYMIIHGLPLKCPAGSLPFCKPHGSSLGWFSLANHISPWSNSRAVAPGRWWGRSAKDAHGSGPEQPLGESACWITFLQWKLKLKLKEQVLELFHGTMAPCPTLVQNMWVVTAIQASLL